MISPALGSLSLLACLTFGIGAIQPAHGHVVVVGVNVANPQRLSPADRAGLLDQLQMADVKVIRVALAPPWGGNDYGPAIDFIRTAYERGLKTDLVIGLQYREGTRRRPPVQDLPLLWPSYPLSGADPVRFRAVFEPLLSDLEGFGVTFAALELGNEINWAGFNGEFPIPGEGRVFGREDLDHDSEARQVAEGYRAYLRTLSVLNDIRNHSRLNRGTPILSAGLADPGSAGPRRGARADAVTITATLRYLRENGMDALVDAYGVHTYPWAKTDAGRRDQLAEDTLAECRSPAQGKPCWLTEWGLPAPGAACVGDDASWAARVRGLLGDLQQFVSQGRLNGLLYFSWNDAKYGIYRCGALTESGRLALGLGILHDRGDEIAR
jgi:hypothetical protein